MVLFDAEFIEGFLKTKTSKNQFLLGEKNPRFFREYLKFSDFGQNAKGQFWPIFITELWQPWKTRNTYQIWLKMVLFDAEFIGGFVTTKTSKNQCLLAEKNPRFLREYLKFSDFGQNAKGQFWPIFITELWQPWKTRNTYQIWLKMVLFDAEFIAGFVKIKTSKNQCLLAEKNPRFFREYLKFSDFGQNAKSQFWPIFITELWQPWKTRNTYQIWLKMVFFDAEFIEGFVESETSKNQFLLAEK